MRPLLPLASAAVLAAEHVLVRGGAYQRVVSLEDRTLVVRRQFVLACHIFEPEEYAELKAFFEAVAATDAEMVVLARQEGPRRAGAVEAGRGHDAVRHGARKSTARLAAMTTVP